MKTLHSTPSKAAFTLIELLVVISIIAVLASLAIPATSSAMVNAKKAQARNDMAQIANAIKLYYTEYGRYPVDNTTVSTDSAAVYGLGEKGNEQIISILRYKTSTGVDSSVLSDRNPRQIKFIEPKVTSSTKGCVNTTSGKWFDPWGTEYVIFIDADYDGEIYPKGVFSSGLDLDSDDKAPVSVGVASGGYYFVKQKGKQQTQMSARAFSKTTDLLSWQ